MRKITLFLLVWMCAISAFSTRYLVQPGTDGAATWRAAGANEVIVDLAAVGQSLNEWYNGDVLAENDEVWLVKGTYMLTDPLTLTVAQHSVCGGFAGTETSLDERAMGVGGEKWDFANPTILDGSLSTTNAITTPAVKNDIIIDGLTITNCKRETGNGGGVSMRTGVTLQNCIISNNEAIGGGGGIMMYKGGTLKSCLIENNIAKQYNSVGGGIYAVNGDGLGVEISDCIIQNNTVRRQGGGLYLGGSSATGSEVSNTIIRGNRCEAEDGTLAVGGGIYTYASLYHSFSNCIIVNNSGSSAITGGFEMTNCTVANNEGGVAISSTTSHATPTRFVNNIVWGNTGTYSVYATNSSLANGEVLNCGVNPTVFHTSSDNWARIDNFSLNANNDNDSEEGDKGPGFNSPTSFVGAPTNLAQMNELETADWNIKSSSGAIDMGTAVSLTSDIIGTIRPLGGAYDVGAYEFDPSLTDYISGVKLSFGVTTVGNVINVLGLEGLKNINVYSINGVNIFSKTTSESDISIPVPDVGIYLLKVNNEVVKVPVF